MKRPTHFITHITTGLVLIFLATACNSPSKVQSVSKDAVDFSRFKTYAFINPGAAKTVPGVNPGELAWTRAVVKEELGKTRFSEVPESQAEMLVSVETEISGGREKGGISLGFGTGSYSRRSSSSVGVSTGPIGGGYVEQSTLTIRIVEAKTNELLWVGWIDKLEDRKFSQTEFKAKVREVMAQFPAAR